MADSKPSYRAPPLMRDQLPYVEWKKELEIWSDCTELTKERQGGALFLTLVGKARQAVHAGVSGDKIKSDKGVKEITDCLDELFMKDKSQSGFAAYDDFTSYWRPPHTSIQDYLVEFNLKYSRIKSFGMTLPEGVLAYYLLKCADLTAEQNNICRATCSSLTYKDMRSQIEKVTSNMDSSNASHSDEQVTGVQSQYYGYEYPEETEQYDFAYEDEDSTCDTFYSKQQPYRSQYVQRPVGSSSPKPHLNPLDEFGNHTKCSFCHSIYHWVARCPENARSLSAPRRNTLYRGRARGGRGSRGGTSHGQYLTRSGYFSF